MSALKRFTPRLIIGITCFVNIASAHAAELSTREQFDRGLLQEEIHQDLQKAIGHYKANVDAFDAQRAIIAMSLFRLAECYRKLGHMDQAAPLYARITEEFSDQESLVLMSERFVPEAAGTEVTAERPDGAKIQTLLDVLAETSPEEAMLILSKDDNDTTAATLLKRLHDSETKLASMKQIYGDNHTEVVSERMVFDSIREQMKRHAGFSINYLKNRLESANPNDAEASVVSSKDQPGLDGHPATLRALITELQAMPPSAAASMIEQETNVRLPGNVAHVEFMRTELKTAERRYKPRHPRYIESKRQLEKAEAALEGEVSRAIKLLEVKLRVLENSPELFDEDKPPTATNEPEHIASDPEKKLLEEYRKISIEQPDLLIRAQRYDQPKIHDAAQRGYINVVRFFLDQGVDVNLQDHWGRTPLHIASEEGNLALVRFLLSQADVEIDSQEPFHSTPLHIAAKKGFLLVAKELVASGADVNAKSRLEGDLSRARAISDHIAKRNLRQPRASIVDGFNESRLGYALTIYPKLLTEGNTPLHLSCQEGYMELSEWFLENGAEVNATNRCGLTPLLSHLAHSSMPLPQHVKIVKLLLTNGADPSIMGEVVVPATRLGGMSRPNSTYEKALTKNALQFSFFKNPPTMMSTEADAKIRNRTDLPVSWTSPLHLAPAFGGEIMKLLLKHGADSNQSNYSGATPLHSLFYQVEEQPIERFIEFHTGQGNRLNPTVKDDLGFMPIEHALFSNHHLEAAQRLNSFVPQDELADYVSDALWNYLAYSEIHKNSLALLANLLEHAPGAVNQPGPQNTLPIEHAILERRSAELTDWLINQGAKRALTEKLRETRSLIEQGDRNDPGHDSAILLLLNRLE